MKKQLPSLIIGLLLIAFPLKTLYAQQTVELTASKDNTLYESSAGDISNGSGDYIFAGTTNNGDIRRALLRFELSGIPSGADIVSAELRLQMNKTISGEMTMTIQEVLTAWGEGASDASGEEGGGTSAQENDATWSNTFYPNQDWQSAGGDFSSTAVSSAQVNGSGSYTWSSSSQFTSLVQKWLDTPEDNHGLILIGNEANSGTAKRFASRNNSGESIRPLLVVQYTAEATSNDIAAERPDRVELHQNYPNPFNPVTVISFTVTDITDVEISVYDMLGRKLQTLLTGRVQAGQNSVTFDASNLSSGIYLYTLRAGDQTLTRRMTILK